MCCSDVPLLHLLLLGADRATLSAIQTPSHRCQQALSPIQATRHLDLLSRWYLYVLMRYILAENKNAPNLLHLV